jgi:hypothetical protein
MRDEQARVWNVLLAPLGQVLGWGRGSSEISAELGRVMIAIASAKLNVKIDNQFCGVGFRLHGRVVITAARLRHFLRGSSL